MKTCLLATLALASTPLFAQTSITLQPGQSSTIKPGQDVTVMCANTSAQNDIRVEFYNNTRCQPAPFAIALSSRQCAALDTSDNTYSYRVFSNQYNACVVAVQAHSAKAICEQIYL